jgi:pimeloyl-ACP methyl ester carboxylesterase
MINFYHGLIGSHVHFDATISKLGAQCGVCHTPDLPYLTTDLDALVDRCKKPSILPSVYVGNSLGCALAVKAAGPDDQLILTAAPFDYGQGVVPLARTSVSDWVKTLYVNHGAIKGEAAIIGHAGDQVRGLLESRTQIKRLRSYKSFAQTFWEDPQLVAAQDRIIFVIGDADFTTPEGQFTDFVRQKLPGASVEVWKDCGHAVPLDAPGQLAALIRHRWLRLKKSEGVFAQTG